MRSMQAKGAWEAATRLTCVVVRLPPALLRVMKLPFPHLWVASHPPYHLQTHTHTHCLFEARVQ